MSKLHSVQLTIENATKEIAVFCEDATTFDEQIDILTTSAYVGSYEPTPRTIFRALYQKGIDVEELASDPEFDLRDPCNIWLSKKLPMNASKIGRIGCIELIGYHLMSLDEISREHMMINSIRAYFRMLDIASLYGVKIDTVALPLIGSGSQSLPCQLLLIPLINECISFLKKNAEIKKIYFIEKNPEKAELIANALKNSYRFSVNTDKKPECEKAEKLAFISYASQDKNIADNLCFKLESKGIKVWYAPRDTKGPYAESITLAIDAASYFIVILSQNSMSSEHVLNEIDLAFQNLSKGIKFKPLRIDNAIFTPSFKYYLSRQHWMDASIPPLEERLNEFVSTIEK